VAPDLPLIFTVDNTLNTSNRSDITTKKLIFLNIKQQSVHRGSSTVRLIHFTLREYLSAHPNIFSRPHSAVAEICLTYLNSNQIEALSAVTPDDLSALVNDNPLLEYCSAYWGVHAKRELSDCARSLALDFLLGYDAHISNQVLWKHHYGKYLDYYGQFWSSGLHYTSLFGISELVAAVVEMGYYDVNERDSSGILPLPWQLTRSYRNRKNTTRAGRDRPRQAR